MMAADLDMGQLLTVAEAMEYLKCSRTALYHMLRTGVLLKVKLGMAVRIPLRSLEQAVALRHDERLRHLLLQAKPEWRRLIRVLDDYVVVRGVGAFEQVGRRSPLPVDEKARRILNFVADQRHVAPPHQGDKQQSRQDIGGCDAEKEQLYAAHFGRLQSSAFYNTPGSKLMKNLTAAVAETVAAIRPLLVGKGPDVQSAALADLTAVYLAGIAPPLRAEMRGLFIDLVDQLVPVNEKQLFGEAGHPYGQGHDDEK